MRPIQLIVLKQSALSDVGKQADITIYDAPNLDYLFYFFATNLVTDVYKKGQKSFNLLHFIWDFARLQKSAKSFLNLSL